jgi:phage/conjugal plasmid C-4 type zinc finger TraR family protein
MNFTNAAYDQADELAEKERQCGIEAASKELSGSGFTHCIDCGAEIDRRRRAALPSAKRCFPCQQAYELDQVMM